MAEGATCPTNVVEIFAADCGTVADTAEAVRHEIDGYDPASERPREEYCPKVGKENRSNWALRSTFGGPTEGNRQNRG